jgi:uncharacterized protein
VNQTKVKLNFNLDYRLIIGLLLVVIAVMLFVWKPWQSDKVTDRTIEVTGTSTISARPDEFVFYPTYEFENEDKDAALKQLSAKSAEIVAGLKERGVADKDIKVNSDSWSYPVYERIGSTATYTLRLTVTVGSQALAQKVQDYLVSTTPSGTISPQANFSESKRKVVEAEGRDKATKDARQKAEQSAKNLGFKLASVKTVNDGSGFGGVVPLYGKEMTARDSSASLPVQPGENELTYTVTVTYYIK